MTKEKIKLTLPLLFTSILMINHGHYVHGVGYQGENPTPKGNDYGDSSSPANYKFEYGVDDEAVGSQFGHEEERNGFETRGRYSVLLPDGRLQVVTYKADKNGYVAKVTYENGPSMKQSSGHDGRSKNNKGGGTGYEQQAASQTSYGPPIPPQQPEHSQYGHQSNNSNKGGYNEEKGIGFNEKGSSKSMNEFGRKKSRSKSFVNFKRTVNGRMFRYAY